jgi:hypothetical protein
MDAFISSTITSWCLLSGIFALQVWVFYLWRQNNKQLKPIKRKLFHLLSFIQTLRFDQQRRRHNNAIIEKSVDTSTVAIEAIHQTLSKAAFGAIETLAENDLTKNNTKRLRSIHDQGSSSLYQSVREINKQLGSLTNHFFSSRKLTHLQKKEHSKKK